MKKHSFIFSAFFVLLQCVHAQMTFNTLNNVSAAESVGAVSFLAGGRAFIGLGQIGANQYSKAFYRYDQNLDAWNVVASFPAEGRAYAIAFVADGKAYVGFGERTDALTNKVTRVYADLYEYDPIADTWSAFDKGSQSAMTGLGQASVFTVKENGRTVAHITGGRNILGVQGAWYSYTPALNQWSYPVNIQSELKRYGASATTVNNKGYIIGGKDDSKTWDKVLQYDPSALGSKLTVFATQSALAKNNTATVANGSNIFMAYGDGSTIVQFNTGNKQIKDWGDILKLKGIRQGMISFLYLNKIFIGLGRSLNGSLNNDLYAISGLTTESKDILGLSKEIKIYPNPSDELLNIELNEQGNYQIILRDLTGRVVNQLNGSETTQVALNQLINGMYICEIWQYQQCLIKEKIIVLH
jgi:hypothetical protein